MQEYLNIMNRMRLVKFFWTLSKKDKNNLLKLFSEQAYEAKMRYTFASFCFTIHVRASVSIKGKIVLLSGLPRLY